MDKQLSLQPNKVTKNRKISKNKRPLKVVYITNPRRVTATASEFRALVQELTGQNAVVPEHDYFAGADERHVAGDDDADDHSSRVASTELLASEGVKGSDPAFEPYNDDFFAEFMASSLFYEPHRSDSFITSSDTA